MASSRPSDIFQPGEVLNSTYRIEAILGRGGTSEVYRARSEISDRVVALKVLSSEFSNNDDYLLLMTREEEIRDVRHDAVVRYSETSRTPDGHVYLTMDFVDGPSLEEKMKAGGMSADDLMAVAGRVCEGLVATHARNIIHRDLSPDNILLRNGEPGEAVIIDFGIARDTNPGAATIVGNEFAGKYAYAAPEQLNGKSDARSDLYGLGALLLATYRGKKPDVGRNPMEVIENKSKPLNVDGVPEPLGSLILRMTHPEPDQRFQSAVEVLGEIQPEFLGTVIGTPGSDVSALAQNTARRAAAASENSGAGKALKIILGGGFILAAAAGLYFSGVMDGFLKPSYPVASPYTLDAQGGSDMAPIVTGHVPNEDLKDFLDQLAVISGGQSSLTLSSGDLHKNWSTGLRTILDQVTVLDEWNIAVDGNMFQIIGRAENEDIKDSFLSAVSEPETFAGLNISSRILAESRLLSRELVEGVLRSVQDCGPLVLVNPPLDGYEPDASIVVGGRLSSNAVRGEAFDALTAVVGDRRVLIDADIIGAEACLVDVLLPTLPTGDFDISFMEGKSGVEVPSGEYRAGENPVIDILVPGDVLDGYLSVTIVDISGDVFHPLPNKARTESSISQLRAAAGNQGRIRATFGIEESGGQASKLAFNVDDRIGASRILVFHTTGPMFDIPRPRAESMASYAEEMLRRLKNGDVRIRSLQQWDLKTVR